MATKGTARKQGGTGKKTATRSQAVRGNATDRPAAKPGAQVQKTGSAKQTDKPAKGGAAKTGSARAMQGTDGGETTFFWLFGFGAQKLRAGEILNQIRKAGVPIKVSRRHRRGRFSEVSLIDAKDDNIQELAFLVSDVFYSEEEASAYVRKGEPGFKIFDACTNCVLISVGPG